MGGNQQEIPFLRAENLLFLSLIPETHLETFQVENLVQNLEEILVGNVLKLVVEENLQDQGMVGF